MKVPGRVYGVGINDADYLTCVREELGYTLEGKRVRGVVFQCPYYNCWTNMLKRSYNEKELTKHPSYLGCSVVPEWHYFMTFKSWMESQDWEGKQLDKDILFPGNKIYSPETCVFVDAKVNTFILESTATRGEWPIGVSFEKERGKFQAACRCIETNKRKFLGRFEDPDEAHKAWLKFKLEQAKILASEQTDPRVAKALTDRYENYQR